MLREITNQSINNQCQKNQQLLQESNYYSFSQKSESPTKIKQVLNKKGNGQLKKLLQGIKQVGQKQQGYQKNQSEKVDENGNILTQELSRSVQTPVRKGRQQKLNIQEQLNEANKSLQAFRDKSSEIQQRQTELKNQYRGLSEKSKKFDKEIGDFTTNSKQLQEYTSEIQRDLKIVSQNQKQAEQDTRENLTELVNKLLQYRDQSQIMELLGDAISQKDQILKGIIEGRQLNQNKQANQSQNEADKLLQDSTQQIEETDKQIKELTLHNQQLTQNLKEKTEMSNELVLKLSEKEIIEASLRKQMFELNYQQVNELNQKQATDINEILKIQEKTLQDNFSIQEKAYIQRINMLESQLHEKLLSESHLKSKILDLENVIKKQQKDHKLTESLNIELKDIINQKQKQIEQLKKQQENTTQQNQHELKIKSAQNIKKFMEIQQSNQTSPEGKKKNFYAANQSFEKPASKSFSGKSVQIDSARVQITDITKIEKDNQMNQVFNELKLYNEQTNKPTLSQMKLKTMTSAHITPIMSTIKSGYISRETSTEQKQINQNYGSANNIHNTSSTQSNISNANSTQSNSTQSYHPPLSVGGNTAQYLQNRIIQSQKLVFKQQKNPQKTVELSPISRQDSSVSKQIYILKQSNLSNKSYQQLNNTSNLNSSLTQNTQ